MMLSDLHGVTISKWAFVVLGQAYLLCACDPPSGTDEEGVVDGLVDGCGLESWSWTGQTSDEYPPLSCPSGGAVHGVECEGNFCDDIELHCMSTGRVGGVNTWLPYFSEEGDGSDDQARCKDPDMWMSGISCRGFFCDFISIECSQIIDSSTGTCDWSEWYSEEQPPFHAPAGDYFLKGVECDGNFCDQMRYQYCEML
jgi:hypothetical protein